MQGKIIRGIGGFYYIYPTAPDSEVRQLRQIWQQSGKYPEPVEQVLIECRAKGIFRNQNIKPLVGDDVEINLLDEEKALGSITMILPRRNKLIRPAVANVDQAVVVFAMSFPKPNLNLLDRFLLMMETQQVPTVICFNKCDDTGMGEAEYLRQQYEKSSSVVVSTSTVTGEGLEEFRNLLQGKTSVLAGPSGVGKSSVMNAIFPQAAMAIGDISHKIKRGKHTTRHSELFCIDKDTYIMDTPGFTSLRLPDIEKEELSAYYPEFGKYLDQCRFLGCAHISEPDCVVKEAVEKGEIPRSRYDNYKQFYEELNQIQASKYK